VGPVSTCRRELLWGWWWPTGLMVSFMIFTASVRNILDIPLYNYLLPSSSCKHAHFLLFGHILLIPHNSDQHCYNHVVNGRLLQFIAFFGETQTYHFWISFI
jgi:hypothetical protein